MIHVIYDPYSPEENQQANRIQLRVQQLMQGLNLSVSTSESGYRTGYASLTNRSLFVLIPVHQNAPIARDTLMDFVEDLPHPHEIHGPPGRRRSFERQGAFVIDEQETIA